MARELGRHPRLGVKPAAAMSFHILGGFNERSLMAVWSTWLLDHFPLSSPQRDFDCARAPQERTAGLVGGAAR